MEYSKEFLEQIALEEKELDNVLPVNGIRYHNITHDDMKNGDGLRVVLWVAGCEHHCVECHNPITWNPNGGIPFTPWEEAEFWDWLGKSWTQGATFSGGDPLHPRNRDKIGEMARKIKEKYPDKDVWVYTGYELHCDGLHNEFSFWNQDGDKFFLPWLDCIDILVDGKFEFETRKKDLANNQTVCWRGSSNQRLIDIQKSIQAGSICLR